MDKLQAIVDMLPSSASAIAGSLALLVEVLCRAVPSEKPLSIAYAVARCFDMLGAGFAKLGGFLDKVLPQKLK